MLNRIYKSDIFIGEIHLNVWENVVILEAWWTHIRPRFSRDSVWSPLTWFTLRPKRTAMNLKWRNEGKGGEEQSDHLSWVSSFSWNSLTTTRTLNKKKRFYFWGNWICVNDVEIYWPVVQVVLQVHAVLIPPARIFKVCLSGPNWKCDPVQFLSPCILRPWKPCWTSHWSLTSSETPGFPERVDMK